MNKDVGVYIGIPSRESCMSCLGNVDISSANMHTVLMRRQAPTGLASEGAISGPAV